MKESDETLRAKRAARELTRLHKIRDEHPELWEQYLAKRRAIRRPESTPEQRAIIAARARARRAALSPEQLKAARLKANARMKDYRQRNKERVDKQSAERAAQWRKDNPEKYRDQHLQYKYGITLSQFERALAAQGGKCATCPATEPGGKGAWHVDHCHTTGAFRGILCRACNTALGIVKDNPAVLDALAQYLRDRQ